MNPKKAFIQIQDFESMIMKFSLESIKLEISI